MASLDPEEVQLQDADLYEFLTNYLTKHAYKSYRDLTNSLRYDPILLNRMLIAIIPMMGNVRFWNSHSKLEFMALIDQMRDEYVSLSELRTAIVENFKEDFELYKLILRDLKLDDKVKPREFDYSEVLSWLDELESV